MFACLLKLRQRRAPKGAPVEPGEGLGRPCAGAGKGGAARRRRLGVHCEHPARAPAAEGGRNGLRQGGKEAPPNHKRRKPAGGRSLRLGEEGAAAAAGTKRRGKRTAPASGAIGPRPAGLASSLAA